MEFYMYLLVIWSVLRALKVVNASENIALSKGTNHSSTHSSGWASSKAVDGCVLQYITSNCCTHTAPGQTEAWWQVDLQTKSVIDTVTIIYRDEGTLPRLAGYEMYLSLTSDWTSGTRCHMDTTPDPASMSAVHNVICPGVARYLTIYNDRRVKAYSWYSDAAYLELCEVQVYGCPNGKYGSGNCNGVCMNCLNNICDTTSGCRGCAAGYYKVGGSCTLCPVNCAGNTCDSVTGTCLECDAGFYGNICNTPCPSNCLNNVCDKGSGHCPECDAGFYGNICEQPCSSNCKNNVCDKDSGHCPECDAGFYGTFCNQPCPTTCLNNFCDKVSAQCLACVSGFHGNNCLDRCGYCQGGRCDKDTGNCMTSCIDGLTGYRCDVKVLNVPSKGEDFKPTAIGIGIGSGVVIVALIIVIILLVRRQRSGRQRDTTRSTTITDITLPSKGKDLQTNTDDPYDVIDAKKGPDSVAKASPADDTYERLGQRDVEVPHIYENK